MSNALPSLRNVAASLIPLLVLFGVLFGSAATLHYWQAWVFWSLFLTANIALGIYLKKTDPALLERRMRVGPTAEKRQSQQIIMLLATFGFIAVFAVAGLDHRFGWSHVPTVLVIGGDLLILLSYVIFIYVFRANTYASSTIELAKDQQVISTGLYHFVRHPMYSGALLLCVGIALSLGSYWDILSGVALLPVLIWRLTDEEKFLRENLSGYIDYCSKVKFRLIPFIY